MSLPFCVRDTQAVIPPAMLDHDFTARAEQLG